MKKTIKYKILSLFATLVLIATPVTVLAPPGPPATAVCDATVTAPDAIQTAVDAASFGDVICLSGTFDDQTVFFDSDDSGITLMPEPGSSGVLDGSGSGLGAAIELGDGVHHLTFKGLEVKGYDGFHGSAIVGWGVSTSHVKVIGNDFHDNVYNGILIGSEGDAVHDHWMVADNTIEDNHFAGVELTNCQHCGVFNNEISGSTIGVLVQARVSLNNTNLLIRQVNVFGNDVEVVDRDAELGFPFPEIGIYFLGFAADLTFSPLTNSSAELNNAHAIGNSVDGASRAVQLFGLIDGSVTNAKVINNELSCGSGGSDVAVATFGNVDGEKVVNNDVDATCES